MIAQQGRMPSPPHHHGFICTGVPVLLLYIHTSTPIYTRRDDNSPHPHLYAGVRLQAHQPSSIFHTIILLCPRESRLGGVTWLDQTPEVWPQGLMLTLVDTTVDMFSNPEVLGHRTQIGSP